MQALSFRQSQGRRAPARTRYLNVLQIVGTLLVMAYHVDVIGTQWGWFAVEIFFALAGRNMAAALERNHGPFEYLGGRIRRLAPELAITWIAVAVGALHGIATAGTQWFLLTSTVFLENLAEPLFKSGSNADWAYIPLWFVAALLQLQAVLYLLRKLVLKWSPAAVATASVIVGLSSRWLTVLALGSGGRDIDDRLGDILYCLPFTHLEAITFGVLVGRGALRGLARHLPALVLVVLGASLLNASLSSSSISLTSLGLEFPLRTNYMHVWGYTALALVAAALCSTHNFIGLRLQRLALPPWVDATLSRLGSSTYGAYVFHGPIIAFGINLGPWLRLHDVRFAGLTVFATTAVEAFALALIARAAVEALAPVSQSDVSEEVST